MARLFRVFLSFTLVMTTVPAWSAGTSTSVDDRVISKALNHLQNSVDAGALIQAVAGDLPASLKRDLLSAQLDGVELPKFEREGNDIVLTDGSAEVRISVEVKASGPVVSVNGVALMIDERTSLADLQNQVAKILGRKTLTSQLWNLIFPQAHADTEALFGLFACFGFPMACLVVIGVVAVAAGAYVIYHESTRPACDSAAKELITVLDRTRTDKFEILSCDSREQKALLIDKRLIGSDLYFALVANEKGQALEQWKPKYHGLADGYTMNKRYTGFKKNHDGRLVEISYLDSKGKPQEMRASDTKGDFAQEVRNVSSFLMLVQSQDLNLKDACAKCDNDIEKINAQIRERKAAR